MKLPTLHEIAVRNMFNTKTSSWLRWVDRVKIDWWKIRF